MHRSVLLVGASALLLAACGGSTPAPSVTPPPAVTPLASGPESSAGQASAPPEASASSAPLCADRPPPSWVTEASHPKDGIPDPAGRIFFSQYARETDILGQIVAPLYAIDPDGSDLVQLLDCEVERPRVSPDGSRLAFSIVMDDGSWQVATSAADGSDLRILTSTPGYAETPDWSPDGSWLIYSNAPQGCQSTSWSACLANEGNRWSLWRVNVDGTDQQRIGRPDTVDWEARLSPDGIQVVFSRFDVSDDLRQTLWIRDLGTGEERLVTSSDRALEHPDWSRDGESIVYNTITPGCGRVCEQVEIVPADDPDAEPVVLYPADEARAGIKPAYSPEGSQIVFGCGGALCLMDANGSAVLRLLHPPGLELNHFDWGVASGLD